MKVMELEQVTLMILLMMLKPALWKPQKYICSEKGSGVTRRLASVCIREDMSCVSFSSHLG